jgi:8-oxo-dGTP pyrophosphatase MutT (NUDIX family)
VAGAPPPWSVLPPEARVLHAGDLRRAFTRRVGVPSVVESMPGVAARPSAVVAPFYEEGDELYVVLTRRSWSLRAHTGELSFPGGVSEPGETPVQAALREAQEEVDLDPSTVEVLGELDHLMTVTSRSFIVPLVALLPGRPALSPNPAEVDAVLHVPVAELVQDEVYREELWRFEGRPPWVPPEAQALSEAAGDRETLRSIFFFELVGDTLWGATAAMLRHLLGTAFGLGTAIDHA